MNEADYRMLLGGYVSNILDDDERMTVDAHLAGCADCQRELAALSDAAGRLTQLAGRARDADDDVPDMVQLEAEGARLDNDLVLARTLQVVRDERRRARRPRIVAAAAAVAVLLVGGGVAGALIEGGPSSPPSSSAVAGARTFTARDATSGVGMTVTVIPQKVGFTRLEARLIDEPANAHCQLIAIGTNGQREVASSWAVGPHGSGAAGTKVSGSVALPTNGIRTIEVRTLAGGHIVSVSTA